MVNSQLESGTRKNLKLLNCYHHHDVKSGGTPTEAIKQVTVQRNANAAFLLRYVYNFILSDPEQIKEILETACWERQGCIFLSAEKRVHACRPWRILREARRAVQAALFQGIMRPLCFMFHGCRQLASFRKSVKSGQSSFANFWVERVKETLCVTLNLIGKF